MKSTKAVSASLTTPTEIGTDLHYMVDTSSAAVTITLSTATRNKGREVSCMINTAGNALTLGTLYSDNTYSSSGEFAWIQVVSDGTEWVITAMDNFERD